MLVDDLITAVRRCRPCGRDLPLTEFSKSTRNGYQSACKACRAAKFKEWKARGYTAENVVPCCGVCNTARSDNFSHEEFIEIAAAIRSVLARRETR